MQLYFSNVTKLSSFPNDIHVTAGGKTLTACEKSPSDEGIALRQKYNSEIVYHYFQLSNPTMK